MLTVDKLTFEYPGVRALDDVSFSISDGSITALVGPNGAGKTTLLRCLAALDEPFSGSIRFDGVDVLDNPRECHRKLGYLSDFFGLYDDLTVEQCLLYIAMAHGMPEDKMKAAVRLAADRVGIAGRLHEKAGALSRGLRQRLAIAQAIIHEPKVLLLDEPASGLDPEARSALSGLFLGLRDQGMTLVVSSHIIAELEEYSTEMLVLRAGKVAGHRPVGVQQAVAPIIKVSLALPFDEFAAALSDVIGVTDVRVDGLNGWFRFAGDAEARHGLLKELIAGGLSVASFSEEKADMQREYLAAVGHGKAAREARQ